MTEGCSSFLFWIPFVLEFLVPKTVYDMIIYHAYRLHEPGSLNIRETADFIVNSWEGAIVRMKVQKNTEALRLFDRMIFDGILRPATVRNKGGTGNGKRCKAKSNLLPGF